MKSFLLTISSLFIILNFSYGQGIFLDKGKSGVGAGIGFVTNSEYGGLGGGVGFSIEGIFDIGISAEFGQLEYNDGHVFSYAPNATLYLMKQDEKIPFSLSVGGAHIVQEVFLGGIVNRFFAVNFSIYQYFYALHNFKIQPSLSYYISDKRYTDGSSIAIGCSLIFCGEETSIFAIEPFVGFSENNITMGIGFVVTSIL